MTWKLAPVLIQSTILAITTCLSHASYSNAATVTFDFAGIFDGSQAPFASGSFNGSFTYDPSIPGVPSGRNGLLPSLSQFSVNFFNSSGNFLFSISDNSPLGFGSYYSPSSTRTQVYMSAVSGSSRSQLNNLSLWLGSPDSGQPSTVFVEGSAFHLQGGYVIGDAFYGGNAPSTTSVNSAIVTIRPSPLPQAIPTPLLLPGLISLWLSVQFKHKSQRSRS